MGAHRARAFAVGIGVFLCGASAAAFPTSRLTYARGTGAETCPAEPIIRQAVAARLGYDPFFATAEKTIVARIQRSRDDLRATVELVDDRGIVRGVREFKARNGQCDELVATMALAISIAIDPTNPGVLGGTPKPRPDPPQPTPASLERPAPANRPIAAASPPAPPEADAPEPDPGREEAAIELRAATAAFGALGTAPAPTTGLALSIGFRKGAGALHAEGRAELPASTADNGSGRVRTSLWAGALVPCLHVDPLSVCAPVWLGSLRAQGIGFPASYVDHALYAAIGLRVGVEIPLSSRWAFSPAVEVLGPLFPADLSVDGISQWKAPALSAFLRAGFAAHFP